MKRLPHYVPRGFAVTVDVVVFSIRNGAVQVPLIERGVEPYKGQLALPGGFVLADEDLYEAAIRELGEETSLDDDGFYLEQLRTYGAPARDPRGRVVTVAYWAICRDLPVLQAGGDAAETATMTIADFERGGVRLAFDHEHIVRDALERLRSKMEYTAVAARFCPPAFTVAQLRRVYDLVWGTRLDPGNFQRSVQGSEAFVRAVDASERWPEEEDDPQMLEGAPVAFSPPPMLSPLPGQRLQPSPARPAARGRPAAEWVVLDAAVPADGPALPLGKPLARRKSPKH